METERIQEVWKNIYRIQVPLPNNPLRATNSYLIRGGDRELLIDTGFDLPSCREALEEALKRLGSRDERRGVLVTHMHADHMGLAETMAGERQPVFMSRADIQYYRTQVGLQFDEARFSVMTGEGFPPEKLREAMEVNRRRIARPKGISDSFQGLSDQELLEVGDYGLHLLLTPGHTPGNSMLYEEREGILFTGDHVLFGISPNITSFPGFRNALGQYLESLHKYAELPVKLALPGHRESGDYRQRVRELLEHHERRLGEMMEIIRANPGLSGYEIAGRMTWRIRSAKGWEDFPLQQKYYAMGESLSHLDYLLEQGRIGKRQGEDGIFRYEGR